MLVADLRALGVRPGAIVMVHTRMSALGWVVGGSETVVRALLDAVGPEGTVCAYAGWEDHVFRDEDWPAEHRDAYRAEPPLFDVATSEAVREHGRIPERLRTWPGAARSDHPEASVVAVGARAGWLTADHPTDHAYGEKTPFARVVEADGQVLMLGAPLDTITLLHHAEAIARTPGKRYVTYQIEDRIYHDIDTSDPGAFPYETLELGGEDAFAVIGRAALAAGVGARGQVGDAGCHLFGAGELTAFAVSWMEERFG